MRDRKFSRPESARSSCEILAWSSGWQSSYHWSRVFGHVEAVKRIIDKREREKYISLDGKITVKSGTCEEVKFLRSQSDRFSIID